MHGRDPRIPTGTVLTSSRSPYAADTNDYNVDSCSDLPTDWKLAKTNIGKPKLLWSPTMTGSPKLWMSSRVTELLCTCQRNDKAAHGSYHGPFMAHIECSLSPTLMLKYVSWTVPRVNQCSFISIGSINVALSKETQFGLGPDAKDAKRKQEPLTLLKRMEQRNPVLALLHVLVQGTPSPVVKRWETYWLE